MEKGKGEKLFSTTCTEERRVWATGGTGSIIVTVISARLRRNGFFIYSRDSMKRSGVYGGGG